MAASAADELCPELGSRCEAAHALWPLSLVVLMKPEAGGMSQPRRTPCGTGKSPSSIAAADVYRGLAKLSATKPGLESPTGMNGDVLVPVEHQMLR